MKIRLLMTTLIIAILLIILGPLLASKLMVNIGYLSLNSQHSPGEKTPETDLVKIQKRLQSSVDFDAGDRRALRGIGFVYGLQDNETKAKEFYGRSSSSADEYVLIGDYFDSINELDKALKWYSIANAENSEYPDLWLKIARTNEAVGNFDAARSLYLKAWNDDPGSAAKSLVLFLRDQGESDLLEEILTASLSQHEQKENRRWLWLQLGSHLNTQRRWDEARRVFDEAINEYHDAPSLYVGRGNTLIGSGGDLGAAMADIEKAIELDSGYASAYFTGGIILNRGGDFSSADAWFAQALDLNPDFYDWHKARAKNARDMSNNELAVSIYQEALKRFPMRSQIYFDLAKVYLDLDQRDMALSTMKEWIKLANENTPDFSLKAASIFISAGDRDEAARLYEVILESDPDNELAIDGLKQLGEDNQ
jgi:tetratricopeptide (TPR) repeat protein